MAEYNKTDALDAVTKYRRDQHTNIPDSIANKEAPIDEPNNTEYYFSQRDEILRREASLRFDSGCQNKASEDERRANAILQTLKYNDSIRVYERAPARQGYGGQNHRRANGDHFLSNADLIEETEVFKVAQKMPKGAHLHIHFNANLRHDFLLNIAKKMPRMFITSTHALIPDDNYVNYGRCEIQFRIRSKADENPGNIFSRDYEAGQTMLFSQFLQEFPSHYEKASADEWFKSKLVFGEEETYNCFQSVKG